MNEAAADSARSLLALPDWEQILAELRESAAVVRRGGGRRNIDRQHARGRLTARERIELLVDPDPPFVELGLFAAFGRFEKWGGAPSAGLITGIGWVEGRPCMLVVNDATVKAGAFFPTTTKKLLRAQTIAARNRLPLIYVVDSAGVFLPLQDEVFPDQDDFGRIFYNNARLSAAGVPQLAAIMGSCVAGGAYLPVMCDKILMTEGSGLYIAGPALVKAAIGQQIDSDELGGARVHARLSGTVDFRSPDDETCLSDVRRLVAAMGVPIPPPPAKADVDEAVYRTLPAGGPDGWPAEAVLRALAGRRTMKVRLDADGVLGATGRVGDRRTAAVAAGGEQEVSEETLAAVADFLRRFEQSTEVTLLVQGEADWPCEGRAAAGLFDFLAASDHPRILLVTAGRWHPGRRLPLGRSLDPELVYAWPTARARGWTSGEDDLDIRHAEAHLAVDRIIEPAATAGEIAAALAIVGR